MREILAVDVERRARKSLPKQLREVEMSSTTSFGSASDLSNALRRAEAAHAEHEKRTGQTDENWPDWYAAYIVAEQAGAELPS
jgi:hypothetical protein